MSYNSQGDFSCYMATALDSSKSHAEKLIPISIPSKPSMRNLGIMLVCLLTPFKHASTLLSCIEKYSE